MNYYPNATDQSRLLDEKIVLIVPSQTGPFLNSNSFFCKILLFSKRGIFPIFVDCPVSVSRIPTGCPRGPTCTDKCRFRHFLPGSGTLSRTLKTIYSSTQTPILIISEVGLHTSVILQTTKHKCSQANYMSSLHCDSPDDGLIRRSSESCNRNAATIWERFHSKKFTQPNSQCSIVYFNTK